MYRFLIRWAAGGPVQHYLLSAASEHDARKAFNHSRVPGVRILSIEPLDLMDDGGASSALVPKGPSPHHTPSGAKAVAPEGGQTRQSTRTPTPRRGR